MMKYNNISRPNFLSKNIEKHKNAENNNIY